jgi:hypothetical protein
MQSGTDYINCEYCILQGTIEQSGQEFRELNWTSTCSTAQSHTIMEITLLYQKTAVQNQHIEEKLQIAALCVLYATTYRRR